MYIYHTAMPLVVSDVTIEEGDDLNLTCIHNNTFGVSLEWLDSEGNVVSNQSTYIVENVARNFSDVYTCVLSGVNNYTITANATVTVECEW